MSEKQLPPSWTWTTLGEIASIQSGAGFPKRLQGRVSGDLPFAKVSDISEAVLNGNGILDGAANYVSVEEAQDLRAEVFPIGSVLFAKIGEAVRLNRRAIARVPILVDNNVMGLIPELQATSPKFLLYFMHTVDLYEYSQATTVPSVRKSSVERIELPLPPLAEQHRIVAEIEKQLTRLDAGVAALRRAQANLRRYKAAVLKAACEGRLVPQDPTDEPASALLQRILAERRARWEAEQIAKGKDPKKLKYKEPAPPDTSELPEGWLWTNLGSLFTVSIGGTPSREKEEYWDGDIPWVSSGEVAFCRIKSTREQITAEGLANSNAKLNPPGTVLLAMIGEGKTRGQAAILDIAAANNQNVASILCFETPILPEWVFFWLMSRYEQTRQGGVASGGMQPALNSAKVRALTIAIAPLTEQQRIIAEVERRLSVVEELEAAVETNLKRAERLRQAVLKRAFEGELVPQDPDDEPAGLLLARIRAEREAQRPQKKPKKKGKKTKKRPQQPPLFSLEGDNS